MSRHAVLKVFLVLGCSSCLGLGCRAVRLLAWRATPPAPSCRASVVEVSSPGLIEKIRTAATDQSGQYRVVDLRPGTYSVTFTLPGFNTIRREGVVLDGEFHGAGQRGACASARSKRRSTVTGESPMVDVQNTMRREVVDRELLDALPTGRDFQTSAM